MKHLLLGLLILCFAGTATAQTVTDTLTGGVVVVKDVRYDLLSRKKAEINKKSLASKTPTRGFRIQVLNTTNRNDALAAKAQLLSLYPEHKTYLMYQAPYFKLRIGNFVERKEADDLKKELNKLFPAGVFVIPSDIEAKPPKEEAQ